MTEELIGAKHRMLSVIGVGSGKNRLVCRCDCGNEIVVLRSYFVYRRFMSCGCTKNSGISVRRPLVDNGDGTHSVPLACGRVAIIDSADAESVGRFNWSSKPSEGRAVYAQRNGGVSMHRQVMDAAKGTTIDHIDGDGLNNRRSNLRVATNAENCRNIGLRSNNRSGFKGVCWDKGVSKWRADITVAGKHVYLGLFDDPEVAHEAYCKAAAELHGEFARTA